MGVSGIKAKLSDFSWIKSKYPTWSHMFEGAKPTKYFWFLLLSIAIIYLLPLKYHLILKLFGFGRFIKSGYDMNQINVIFMRYHVINGIITLILLGIYIYFTHRRYTYDPAELMSKNYRAKFLFAVLAWLMIVGLVYVSIEYRKVIILQPLFTSLLSVFTSMGLRAGEPVYISEFIRQEAGLIPHIILAMLNVVLPWIAFSFLLYNISPPVFRRML